MWCDESKRIITFNVEKPIDNNLNDFVIDPIDAQEEVQPPNIQEEENDDDVQQRSPPLSTTRQKRKIMAPRSYIEECDYVAYAFNIASEVEVE